MHQLVPDLLAAAVVVWVLVMMYRDVTRARLERFARRQCLTVTRANGPVVIEYLATTRRWRATGFLVGLVVALGVNYTGASGFHTGGGLAIVGWFVGAVAAEWRIEARRAVDVRRTASLHARRLLDYVPRKLVAGAALGWTAVVVLGVTELVTLSGERGKVALALGVGLAVLAAIALVTRHVLQRPQPPAAPDLLAADDALRSRSLHVLAGCALAAAGFYVAVIDTVAETVRDTVIPYPATSFVDLIGLAALPVLGWLAATSSFATRRGVPAPRIGAAA